MKQHLPHILIVGGGVIGASIAYSLVKENARVTLVEADDLASGSSGACDGLVFMQSKKPGVHLTLAMESLKRFETLQNDLSIDIEFRKTGGLVVIGNSAEYLAMEKYVTEQQGIGLDVHLLDSNQAHEKEPELSSSVVGAAFSPLDAQVNPISLTLGFALAAKKNHAKIITGTKVLDLLTHNNRITGIVTNKGNIAADIVVNAAGSMAGLIAQMVDIKIPVKPRKGQIVVTHSDKRILNHCLISAPYIAAKYNPELADKAAQGISIEQAANGNLLLGSTREFDGFDKKNTITGIREIVRQTACILPALEKNQIIRSFAGLRPFTPDGLPILGPVKSLDGFVIAAGHEGDGIALAPITGHLMAQALLNKKMDISLDPFSPDRFADREGD